MAKCIGCKIDNALAEHKKRRSITSLMSMRNAADNFAKSFSRIREGLVSEADGGLKAIQNNNRHIESVYPGMCARHIGEFGTLLNTVSACFEDENQKVIIRRSYAEKIGVLSNR